MASVYCAVECPHCGRSAIIDDYYKLGVMYIHCRRCGYNAVKCWNPEEARYYGHEPEENPGYGVFFMTKQNGQSEMMLFNGPIQNEEEYIEKILSEDPELENSYLVKYEEGEFTVLLGTPSENFYLPYADYVKKMDAKYGGFEEMDGLVPIED